MECSRRAAALPIGEGYPCKMCGVNTWTACKHRPAEHEGPPPPGEETDGRKRGPKSRGGQFRRKIHRVKKAIRSTAENFLK